jgi:hypothetical protein
VDVAEKQLLHRVNKRERRAGVKKAASVARPTHVKQDLHLERISCFELDASERRSDEIDALANMDSLAPMQHLHVEDCRDGQTPTDRPWDEQLLLLSDLGNCGVEVCDLDAATAMPARSNGYAT